MILSILLLIIFSGCSSVNNHKQTLANKYRTPSSSQRKTTTFQYVDFLCKQGKMNDAINILSNRYKKNIKNPKYWNTYFKCYYKQNNLNKAEYFINKAIKLSKDPIYKNNLAMIYISTKNYNLAYNFLKKIIYKSKNVSVLFNFFKLSIILNKKITPAMMHLFNNPKNKSHTILEKTLLSIFLKMRKNNFEQAYQQFKAIKSIVEKERVLVPLYIFVSIKSHHLKELNNFAKSNNINLDDYIKDGVKNDV